MCVCVCVCVCVCLNACVQVYAKSKSHFSQRYILLCTGFFVVVFYLNWMGGGDPNEKILNGCITFVCINNYCVLDMRLLEFDE